MIAPGYQASLFPDGPTGPARYRVVDPAGTRTPATSSLALAVGQARALALAGRRAWIVGPGDEAVEVTSSGGVLAVSPRGPGWPATVQSILAEHGGVTEGNPE